MRRPKWEFPAVQAGLVGGHCIGVTLITYLPRRGGPLDLCIYFRGRRINDSMGDLIAPRLVNLLIVGGVAREFGTGRHCRHHLQWSSSAVGATCRVPDIARACANSHPGIGSGSARGTRPKTKRSAKTASSCTRSTLHQARRLDPCSTPMVTRRGRLGPPCSPQLNHRAGCFSMSNSLLVRAPRFSPHAHYGESMTGTARFAFQVRSSDSLDGI